MKIKAPFSLLTAFALVTACSPANGGSAGVAPKSKMPSTGFALKDFSKIDPKSVPLEFPGGVTGRAESNRVTLMCGECAKITAVDVLLSSSTDGTEDRLRSGETTVGKMEALCKARASGNCTMEKVERHGAIGYTSRTSAAGMPVSTTMLFKNGDLLTIRSIAADVDSAFANGRIVLDNLGPKIIGN